MLPKKLIVEYNFQYINTYLSLQDENETGQSSKPIDLQKIFTPADDDQIMPSKNSEYNANNIFLLKLLYIDYLNKHWIGINTNYFCELLLQIHWYYSNFTFLIITNYIFYDIL